MKQRYFAVAKTIAPEPLRITRSEAAEMIGLSKRQLQSIVKRFMEEGIEGLMKKSTRPNTSPSRIPEDVEKRIVEVR
ncbi:MAG: helix-turn-helix domain-containing protein [Nitrososphaeria archaeon]